MNHAIEAAHVTKRFSGFTLDDVSFAVPGGAIVGLIGENGAGKSTLIKCLLGLLRPDGGAISLLEGSSADRAVMERVGVVLDECPFHGALTARSVGRVMAGAYPAWHPALFQDYLNKFGLPKDLCIKTFSKGMKMKLSIAAALAHHPKLLVLDEPTGGLDPVARSEILDEFLAFVQDEDHAILVSSHITGDLEKAADRIVYLHKGRVALSGEKDALLEDHGRLVCTKEDLDRVDRAFLVGARENRFGCEAVVRRRREFTQKYPRLTVEAATLEEIMVFTVEEDKL